MILQQAVLDFVVLLVEGSRVLVEKLEKNDLD
jgi:hypothetical protein